MSPADIRAALEDELARIAPDVDFATIDPAADLRDEADIDSMDFLNFIVALHHDLALDVPERDYPRIVHLGDCIEYLTAALGASRA